MTIDTTNNLIDKQNLRICNKQTPSSSMDGTSNIISTDESCININLSDTGDFNITPEVNNNSLIINGMDKSVLAKFNYKTNDIYFGGNGTPENPGALRINNSNIYIKDINLINGTIDNTQISAENVKGFNYNSINNLNNTIICYYNIDISKSPLELTLNMVSYALLPVGTTFNINVPNIDIVGSVSVKSKDPSDLNINANDITNDIFVITTVSQINPRYNIKIVMDSGLQEKVGSSINTNGILMAEVTLPAI
jgi:hypothetical protein